MSEIKDIRLEKGGKIISFSYMSLINDCGTINLSSIYFEGIRPNKSAKEIFEAIVYSIYLQGKFYRWGDVESRKIIVNTKEGWSAYDLVTRIKGRSVWTTEAHHPGTKSYLYKIFTLTPEYLTELEQKRPDNNGWKIV